MPTLYLFTALECEAKPLIKHFDLKKELNTQHFSLYKNDTMVLTITGVGKVSMAAAIGYTFALFPKIARPVIINIGIAGHKTRSLGDLVLVSKSIDTDSEKIFYPQLIGNNLPESGEVITFSKPCTDYQINYLSDMEASAFYESALKFSTSELVHSIKIISDNETSSINEIRSKIVTEWIASQIPEIENLIQHWVKLSLLIKPVELNEYTEILNKCHFSVGSQMKLKTLLQRWNVLSMDSWSNLCPPKPRNSKDILKKLEADINSLELYL